MANKPKKLNIRECKAAGKALVKAQWRTIWPIFLVYVIGCVLLSVIVGQPKFSVDPTVIELVLMWMRLIVVLLCGAWAFGATVISMKLVAAQPVSIRTLFSGFRHRYGTITGLYITNALLIAAWSLLFVIPGIVKAYEYSMSTFILAENPDMGISAARRESMRMTKGHKWQLFLLNLSFIGWNLLSCLTLGFLNVWLAPYAMTAGVYAYQSLKDHQSPHGKLTVAHWE